MSSPTQEAFDSYRTEVLESLIENNFVPAKYNDYALWLDGYLHNTEPTQLTIDEFCTPEEAEERLKRSYLTAVGDFTLPYANPGYPLTVIALPGATQLNEHGSDRVYSFDGFTKSENAPVVMVADKAFIDEEIEPLIKSELVRVMVDECRKARYYERLRPDIGRGGRLKYLTFRYHKLASLMRLEVGIDDLDAAVKTATDTPFTEEEAEGWGMPWISDEEARTRLDDAIEEEYMLGEHGGD